jgi:gliding motility-associated-like protein
MSKSSVFGFYINIKGWFSGILLLVFSLTPLSIVFGAPDYSITIDSVSVNQNNHVLIGWTLHTEIQDGYVEIHSQRSDGIYSPIGRVAVTQTHFIDNSANASLKPYSYYVVAYDNQNNVLGRSDVNAHQSIFLDIATIDECQRIITLSWSNYGVSTTVGQPVPLETPFEYNSIAVSFNGSKFIVNQETDKDTNQISIAAPQSGSYCIYVRSGASGSIVTSTSNVRCIDVIYPLQPEYVYLRKVSIENDQTLISIHGDLSVPSPKWVLEKFHPEENDFIALEYIDDEQILRDFQDLSSLSGLRSEKYRVLALDTCGHEIIYSQIAETIHLMVNNSSSYQNELSWNEYTGWPTGVRGYSIQRRLNSEIQFEEIAFLPKGINFFIDDISLLPVESTGEIAYRTVAAENPGNPFGFEETAFSNVAPANRDVDIFIPNAFRPDSEAAVNRVFRPMFSYFLPHRYSMMVFNRWGQMVFSTKNIETAWDGNHNGKMVPAGVYSYVIAFEDASGSHQERRGNLLLVR